MSDAGGPAVSVLYSTASVSICATVHTSVSTTDVTQKNSELTAKTCLQKPSPIFCFSSDALSAALDSVGCSFLSPCLLYSPAWRFADLYLWHHYFFGNTFLKTDSIRDQAVVYSSICTGVEQGIYRDSRGVTSHVTSWAETRGWPFLNHPFGKVSTQHCYLLVLFFFAWFVLMVVSKEEANLQLYYFKQINWDGKRGGQLTQEASRASNPQSNLPNAANCPICFISILHFLVTVCTIIFSVAIPTRKTGM